MDKYDASNDHYCYAGTSILQNKLNIRDEHKLDQAERDITNQTINNVVYHSPPYSFQSFSKIHYALFSPLYDWAGTIRNVSIAKGGTTFCIPSRIEPEIKKLFLLLANEDWLSGLMRSDLSKKLAEYYCEFNMIHPFRVTSHNLQVAL